MEFFFLNQSTVLALDRKQGRYYTADLREGDWLEHQAQLTGLPIRAVYCLEDGTFAWREEAWVAMEGSLFRLSPWRIERDTVPPPPGVHHKTNTIQIHMRKALDLPLASPRTGTLKGLVVLSDPHRPHAALAFYSGHHRNSVVIYTRETEEKEFPIDFPDLNCVEAIFADGRFLVTVTRRRKDGAGDVLFADLKTKRLALIESVEGLLHAFPVSAGEGEIGMIVTRKLERWPSYVDVHLAVRRQGPAGETLTEAEAKVKVDVVLPGLFDLHDLLLRISPVRDYIALRSLSEFIPRAIQILPNAGGRHGDLD